jgi:hypothetical protein
MNQKSGGAVSVSLHSRPVFLPMWFGQDYFPAGRVFFSFHFAIKVITGFDPLANFSTHK